MGNCISAQDHGNGSIGQAPMASQLPLDASSMGSMDLEQLLRVGISEAQIATMVRPKKRRSFHLHRARALLMEVLKRCGSTDADLRMHVLAVLLKLGADARSVTSLIVDSPQVQQSEEQVSTCSPHR